MPLLLPIVNKGSAERMLRNITDYGDFFYNKTTTKLESNGKDYITDIPENITENDTNDQENEPSKASATETTTDTLAEWAEARSYLWPLMWGLLNMPNQSEEVLNRQSQILTQRVDWLDQIQVLTIVVIGWLDQNQTKTRLPSF